MCVCHYKISIMSICICFKFPDQVNNLTYLYEMADESNLNKPRNPIPISFILCSIRCPINLNRWTVNKTVHTIII